LKASERVTRACQFTKYIFSSKTQEEGELVKVSKTLETLCLKFWIMLKALGHVAMHCIISME
jgi:hypothetical protein